MCPKRIEQRQRVDLDEIVETGEQKIMEMLEIESKHYPVQVIDNDCVSSVSSKFALPNEEINRTIAALEGIDDYIDAAIDEAEDQQTSSHETEEEIAQIDGSIDKPSVEDLAKLFD